jgi:hypothetical protein
MVKVSSRVQEALAFLAVLVLGFGAYIAYSHATRASGPMFSRVATKHCLDRKGFSVTASRIPDEPEHRDLHVYRAPAKPDEYPNLLFFTKRSNARDYAKGDSVPLLRRGNVVVDVENHNGDAESAPEVRVLTDCLRVVPLR